MVNPLDWKTRAGSLKDFFPHTLPFILGWDAFGVVEAVGSGVTKFKQGDEVDARTNRDGTLAEYAILMEIEAALKPKSSCQYTRGRYHHGSPTVWQAFFEKAQLAVGQKVLIHGAAEEWGA